MSNIEDLRQLCVEAKSLLTTAWDMELAERVCERTEDLAEPLNDPRHTSLAEAALGFAAYLSAFTDSRVGPIESRRLQLETLLDAVSEQLDRLETSTALEMAPHEIELTIELAPAPTVALGSAAVAVPATALGLEIKPLDTIVFIDPTGRDAGTLGLALEDVGYVVQPLLRLDRQIGQWMAKDEQSVTGQSRHAVAHHGEPRGGHMDVHDLYGFALLVVRRGDKEHQI